MMSKFVLTCVSDSGSADLTKSSADKLMVVSWKVSYMTMSYLQIPVIVHFGNLNSNDPTNKWHNDVALFRDVEKELGLEI